MSYAAIVRKRPELASRLARTGKLMNDAIRDVLVRDYESLIASIELKDLDDRHVVAAAIKCGAQVIVTFNVDDFPKPRLDPHGIEAQHRDQFVRHLADLDAGDRRDVRRSMSSSGGSGGSSLSRRRPLGQLFVPRVVPGDGFPPRRPIELVFCVAPLRA